MVLILDAYESFLSRVVSWIIMWVDEVGGDRKKEGGKDGPRWCRAALIDRERQRGSQAVNSLVRAFINARVIASGQRK